MISVIIADDHPIFLMGLRQVLETDKTIKIIEQGQSGDEALNKIIKLQPDVAILDLDMPGMNGFEIARELNKKNIRSKIIFLTMHSANDLLSEALKLNVMGYVLKENALIDIIKGIHKVNSGEHYVSSALSEELISHSNFRGNPSNSQLLLQKLTPTEMRIMSLIAQQKTTKEIAEILFISHRTVEKHRSNICDKLNLKGNNSLLKYAIENKEFF
jgi:DNA-binding NarL/FixJ family response regulator